MLDIPASITSDARPQGRPGAGPRAPARPGSGGVRLQVLSDLHLDSGPGALPRTAPGADAVVVAGDTAAGVQKAFAFLRAAFPRPVPLIVVLGNREFHGRHMGRERRLARSLAAIHDITLLDDTVAYVAGMKFIGATLWTNYLLGGAASQADAMHAAKAGIEDHARISLMPEPWIRYRPYDALAQHHASLHFLQRELQIHHGGPMVVVTHHAPSVRSLGRVGGVRGLDACFASDLDGLVSSSGAKLWVHGHTHVRSDYVVGRTRVVANPRGRLHQASGFDPSFCVVMPRGGSKSERDSSRTEMDA